MRTPASFCRRLSLIATLGLAIGPPAAPAATAPYTASRLITGMSWDFSTVTSLRQAHGSDLWPLTWASDGNLYGAWGDGGGFDGDSNSVGRVSLGFARISGVPQAGNPASLIGENIWGDAPQFAQVPATFGGKIDDLISVGGILYGHGGLWTKANCGCADPTTRSGDNPAQRTLVWSSNLGRSWSIAPWTVSADLGSTLQFGQDYRGATEPDHLYLYYQHDYRVDPAHIYLRRVRVQDITADPNTPGHYEYWVGPDANTPLWSTVEQNAVPVFFDPGVPLGVAASQTIVYDAALGRYLLAAYHGIGTGQIGFFEAPNPWGPWATIAYYADWGGFNETGGEGNGLTFPSKWISADGTGLWGVFTGTGAFDAFNVAHVSLSVANGLPNVTVTHVSSGKAYSVGTATLGTLAYIDRTYTLTQLSPSLTGARLIQTANDDKFVSASNYLQLQVDRAATVYVCYTNTATGLPAWLSDGSWSRTAAMCSTSATDQPDRITYRRSVAGGTITLGGNRMAPAAGPTDYSNFVVLIGP